MREIFTEGYALDIAYLFLVVCLLIVVWYNGYTK